MTSTAARSEGRLSADRLRETLLGVCREAKLDATDARLIKFTNNAVFSLASAPVVVRIAGSSSVRENIGSVVTAARWLEASGFPAVRLLSDVPQPISVLGQAATLWHNVAAVGPDPTGADLGALLRDLHALSAPPIPPPNWSVLDRIRRRIADAEIVDERAVGFLQQRCNELDVELANLNFALPPGTIHGDAFLGNVIPSAAGPVICDFDSFSTGPREWDLTPMAVGMLRFNYPTNNYAPLAREYGFDVLRWQGFPTFRRLRELKVVTSVLPVLRSNPQIEPQFRLRLDSLINDDDSQWSPYS